MHRRECGAPPAPEAGSVNNCAPAPPIDLKMGKNKQNEQDWLPNSSFLKHRNPQKHVNLEFGVLGAVKHTKPPQER